MNLNTTCIFFLNQPKQTLSTLSLSDKFSSDSSRTHFQMSRQISGQPSRRLIVSNAASSPSLSGGFPGFLQKLFLSFYLEFRFQLMNLSVRVR